MGGVDSEGKGACYHYDAIGSMERVPYSTSGSGSDQVMSVLDSQLSQSNQVIKNPELDKVDVINMMKDIITSVGERCIYTGDSAEVFVIDKFGVDRTTFELRKD